MYLIQLQNECFSYFIDAQIVPFAPSPIVSQILLSRFAVLGLNLFKLLHELKVNGSDCGVQLEGGGRYGITLWDLDIDGDEKVAEELNVEELAPSGAEIEHELVKDLLIDTYSQQFKGIVVAQPQ